MRLRHSLFALGLVAGLLGSLGCKGTSGSSCSSGSCASASADDLKETKSAKTAVAKDTTGSECTSCSKCSTCRAPSTTPTRTEKAQSVATIASGSGCTTCGGQTEPFPTTIVPASGTTSEATFIVPPPSTVTMLPPIVNTAPGVISVIPATPAGTPSLPGQQPLGPGIEMVSTGGAPIVLPNGDKIVPQSTMTVRFGESNDYQTLVGQVSQFRRTWRLRYAAVESEDKLGGSVILVGGDLDQLKDGQMVRVTGSVLPGEDRASGTRYQVTRVEVIEPGR